jgi:hypothetical protein
VPAELLVHPHEPVDAPQLCEDDERRTENGRPPVEREQPPTGQDDTDQAGDRDEPESRSMPGSPSQIIAVAAAYIDSPPRAAQLVQPMSSRLLPRKSNTISVISNVVELAESADLCCNTSHLVSLVRATFEGAAHSTREWPGPMSWIVQEELANAVTNGAPHTPEHNGRDMSVAP